ncbi:MAG TPA: recombinase family protein, partial [Streptosporangiaceae bacterium]|nr:recombinase family protein [Streptosporangiaceae bacterium]
MGELIGYARCSTVLQDLTAQRQALAALGVPDDRIYLDKGLSGTTGRTPWSLRPPAGGTPASRRIPAGARPSPRSAAVWTSTACRPRVATVAVG